MPTSPEASSLPSGPQDNSSLNVRLVCWEPDSSLQLQGQEGLITQTGGTERNLPSSPLPPPPLVHRVLSILFQATDEDSPPNNQITYSIVNASAFGSHFDISVYEGYAGTGSGLGLQPGGGLAGGSGVAHSYLSQ